MPEGDPWRVLVGAVLSTRTRDQVTAEVVERFIARVPDVRQLAQLSAGEVAELIYPVGFYRTKAKLLVALAKVITEKWGGRVPATREGLLSLPGVGPKVANIVLARCFGVPVIAVDTHVHRISNRLGLVRTKTPGQTEKRLYQFFPRGYRAEWNHLLVALGQTVCLPRLPRCAVCPITRFCLKRGTRAGRGQPGRRADRFSGKLLSVGAGGR